MVAFEPADNLRSRTFLGLLVAQFLAAFNDQAIHASAMFFAINQGILDEAQAISLMPILFYAPWAIFCTLAGYFADRFSKRHSLVAWKFAEILITGLALVGFWMGTHGNRTGAWLVLSTVFLMGMHSAFFVPAKYGAMPEILSSRMLSRGNGLLESLSFLAIILGTVFGGVLSDRFRGQEYIIGFILLGLAVIGSVASLLIRKMPAANPDRPFPPMLYKPLWENVRVLLKSRPLAFAVLGIAFFTFIVAFMRATVYMHGESQVPRWSESQTSEVVGMVALGIGLGSPLVGFLSGGKVELGLIPIGALGMIGAAVFAAVSLHYIPGLIGCIILIGFFTGFYIVPLFTLLQHRAPKTSKGDSIATSNFINVTGAILASLVFFGMDWAARKTGLAPELPQEEVWLKQRQLNLNLRAARVVTSFMRPDWAGCVPQLIALKRVQDAADLLQSGRRIQEIEYHEGRPYRVVLGENRRDEIAEGPDKVIEVNEVAFIDAFKSPLKPGDRVIESVYRRGPIAHHRLRREGEPPTPVYDKHNMPRLLFLSAGGMTLVTLLLLWWLMPDLFRRTRLWFRWLGRCRIEPVGLHHLPTDGPVLLVTNADTSDACDQVVSATDRLTRIIPVMDADAMAGALRLGEVVLIRTGEVEAADKEVQTPTPMLPVWIESLQENGKPKVYVVFGTLMTERSESAIDAALLRTGDEFRERLKTGTLMAKEHDGAH